jgi:hypothetical protein
VLEQAEEKSAFSMIYSQAGTQTAGGAGAGVTEYSNRLLRRDQVSAWRQGRAISTTGKDVVVHVLDRFSSDAEIVKRVIRAAVTVEIGSSRQFIVTCSG